MLRWLASGRHDDVEENGALTTTEAPGNIARVRSAFVTAVIATALVLAAPLSGATFPGKIGLLVYEAKIGKHYQLFTIKADGTSAHQLTHFSDSDAVWGAWSASGKQIAFERDVYTGVQVNRAAI